MIITVAGKAGSGKTYLANQLVTHLREKWVRVHRLAPTGLAALLVEGSTFHSALRIDPTGDRFCEFPRPKLGRFMPRDVIVIDEISMVSAALLDGLDRAIRGQLETSEPFGGLNIVAFGDMRQLPPVVKEKDRDGWVQRGYMVGNAFTPYWPGSKAFLKYKPQNVKRMKLTKIWRQEEVDFLNALNAVGEGNPAGLAYLNQRVSKNEHPEALWLCALKETAKYFNDEMLNKLDTPWVSTQATIVGYPNLKDQLVPQDNQVKVGMQTLIVANNMQGGYVNGSRGILKEIDAFYAVVEVGGREVVVEPFTWKTADSTGVVVGTYTALPIVPSYAMTIHKAQGQTVLGEVEIDMGRGAFTPGQAYVAVSRVTKFENLHLNAPLQATDLIRCPILNYFRNWMEECEEEATLDKILNLLD